MPRGQWLSGRGVEIRVVVVAQVALPRRPAEHLLLFVSRLHPRMMRVARGPDGDCVVVHPQVLEFVIPLPLPSVRRPAVPVLLMPEDPMPTACAQRVLEHLAPGGEDLDPSAKARLRVVQLRVLAGEVHRVQQDADIVARFVEDPLPPDVVHVAELDRVGLGRPFSKSHQRPLPW